MKGLIIGSPQIDRILAGKKTWEMYNVYKETGGKSSLNTFTRKLKRLEEGKFIAIEKIAGGADGNTSIIKLASKQGKERKLTEF